MTEQEQDVKTTFGETLRQYRISKDLTQQHVADFAAMDRAYISELERGKLHPSVYTQFRICRALNIKPADFTAKVDIALQKKARAR